MTYEQTTTLLKLISNLWPNLSVDKERTDAWHFVFEKYDGMRVLTFMRSALTRGIFNANFAPTPMEIIQRMKEIESSEDDAIVLFQMGPYTNMTPALTEAWRLWGGADRWGFLPDVKYCDDPEEAMKTWRFEEKRFAEIYESLIEREEHLAIESEAGAELGKLSQSIAGKFDMNRALVKK